MLDLMEKFEAASAAYAANHDVARDSDWFLLKLLEETGELTQAANRVSGRARPKVAQPKSCTNPSPTKRPTFSVTCCSSPATTASTLLRQSNGSGGSRSAKPLFHPSRLSGLESSSARREGMSIRWWRILMIPRLPSESSRKKTRCC